MTPQFLRRDFLTGTGAGCAAVLAGDWAARDPSAFPPGAKPSYAECGEDVIAMSMLLELFQIARPSYLDVGAHLPIFSSNTYLFYRSGSRGVLVEPNVDLIQELRAKRPQDVVLNIGVGLSEALEADFYCLTLPQWNTFDKAEAERRARDSKGHVRIEKIVKMPLTPINAIMDRHFGGKAPDFLSIDVESLDHAILSTLDFDRFRPKVICAETLIHMTTRMGPEIGELLAARGYEPRGMTFANTIFIDREALA